MKLPGHPVKTEQARRGLPGNVISIYIVLLDPAHSAGPAGHLPVKRRCEMALGTFGAIMGFAAEITGQTGEIYKTLAKKAKDLTLREVLQVLSAEEGKSHSLMEKTRRENVTEMILEPITGLHQEDYGIDLKVVDPMEDADLLRAALVLEEREKKFFNDVSIKVPLPEVARIFRKMAQKKQENLAKLQSLALNQTLRKRT